jgi:predicted permease
MQILWRDLRYGARALLKQPGFTLIALLTLALGIGVNTAIFSVVDAVIFKALPYKDADRLVMLWERPPKFPRNSVSAANFLDWQSQSKLFEQMAARSFSNFNLSGTGQPERVAGARVSTNFFELLGVQTALGRAFLSTEEQPGQARVTVLSHRFWETRFGAQASVVGNTIALDGEPYTVVGVLKPNSGFDEAGTQLFVPLAFNPNQLNRSSHFLTVLARLKPDVTQAQAQAELDAIAAGIAERHPDTNKGWGVTIDPLRDRVINPQLRQTVLILFGAVVFILLIACANLANLTLARVTSRQREIAIRAALGAARWQLVKQFLTESVLLSLLGGALGFALGRWLLDLFTALMPRFTLPAEAQVAVDRRILLFTLGLSVLSGLIFGLVPAWQASKPSLTDALKEGSGAGVGGSRRRLSSFLIVAEVALALTLLIGSGLLIRSLFHLQRAPLGFDGHNVLTLHVGLPRTKYPTNEQVATFYSEALRRLQALPGIERAALVTDLPIVGWSYGVFFGVEGRPTASRSERPAAHSQVISPDYFRTLGIPLLKGRAFTERDNAGAPRVAIINETLARKHFPNEDPLGKRLLDDSDTPVYYEIVGVAGNVKVYGLGDKAPEENAEIYVPYTQLPTRGSFIAVRTTGAPLQGVSAVQRELHALDKDQPITAVSSMAQVIDRTLADERFNTALLIIFATAAALLAAIGIYGVIAYTVAQHTREIGIRLALGAQTGDVLRLMLGQGMVLVGAGVLLGLGASFVLMRVLSGLLSGVSASDPLTFALAALVLAGVSLLACYVPARRATKVDPMIALRYE